MARTNETLLENLIYHTEQTVWKNLTPEHKGYRKALWTILSKNMYSVGDYYIPADEVFLVQLYWLMKF